MSMRGKYQSDGSHSLRLPSPPLTARKAVTANNARVTPPAHHRNGSTDRLGLRSFDAAVFEQPPIRTTTEERQHDLRHQQSRTFPDTRGAEQQQQQSNGRPHPLQNQVYSDVNGLLIHMQASPAPPVGSPYPYPFSHVRRNNAYSAYPIHTAPYSNSPPYVNSTQPRDTSPEPCSSGEETAGEERFEVAEERNWVNGMVPDDGTEWVDEDEDEKDDLLDLEYHLNDVNNIEKRRRR
ncbi:hypothetical protein EV702DRAFT_1202305 [Suillus placidus]|uniref:Uncharacterized protein n=1 Tax=Suillus placidus TaxID=48579 RepID=A0A9P6ZGS6_9AGAM|nr:hypothetical protein EV702DRAFT_1207469 [Suillus placidus]KAG1770831.1 hypothetical protein EV702DRAFT_1202305 [Suillus placidus]